MTYLGLNLTALGKDHVLRSMLSQLKVRLRYEDICRDPLGSSNAIFFKFGFAALQGHTVLQPKVPQQIPENTFLFNGISSIELDEKWRWRITPEGEAIFQFFAGVMYRGFGYV